MKAEKESTYEVYVSTSELAGLLDLSSRRIQQLAKINVFKPLSQGKYPLFESFRRYLNYLRKLLKRYMGLYQVEVERAGRRTKFENLAFYGDLKNRKVFPGKSLKQIRFEDSELQKLFRKEGEKNGR